MPNAIQAGRIFVRDGTALPKTLQIESEPYMPGWRSVSNLDGCALGEKIHAAGWTFFCLAYETTATVFGIDAEKMTRRAIERILANRRAEAEKFNSDGLIGLEALLGNPPYNCLRPIPAYPGEPYYLSGPRQRS